MKLEGKVAIVVGGANGIGKRTAKLFASEGAKVVVGDIDFEASKGVAEEINASGHQAEATKVDHTREEDAFAMVRFALAKFGQIDIMANVAGTHGYIENGQFIRKDEGPFAQSTKALWDSTIDINLNGARNCTRAVINHMMERRTGKIVNFSSIAAIQPAAGFAAYAAAKGGIISFTKTLAREFAPYGIHINCIIPGSIATEQVLDRMERTRQATGRSPDMTRFADPQEVANVVLWLVSDDVKHMSGQEITVSLA